MMEDPISSITKLEKPFDLFRAMLGVFLISTAIYILFRYVLNFPEEITSIEFGILMLVLILALVGAVFFIDGYTDMRYNYDLDMDIKKLKYLYDFVELKNNIEIEKLELTKEEKEKLKKYINKNLKEFVKEIE